MSRRQIKKAYMGTCNVTVKGAGHRIILLNVIICRNFFKKQSDAFANNKEGL